MSIKQFFRKLTGRGAASEDAGASRFQSSMYRSQPAGSSLSLASGERQLRRDLMRVVLRDVQVSAGLAPTWLALEILTTGAGNKPTGMHARIVLRTWVPRIMQHAVTLERMYVEKLTALDPHASDWFRGLSWRLNLPPGQPEEPLPAPAEWFMSRPLPPRTPPMRSVAAGDVIAGPVQVGSAPAAERSARLEALSQQLDANEQFNRRNGVLFAPTLPTPL
ncbi:hypothetical protein [Caenimonas koreensis]|uniref:Uncharacterized protein n=1 Tax=Caenimonas koreensis DSM 17982 TaxID=1121255 RepID=A0A844B6V5_9BURK|nr:hypothetical protein [Caenimonas koreensis]MRD48913.1 hypothetical protein [Caenimonas koreensis DSM 17982]